MNNSTTQALRCCMQDTEDLPPHVERSIADLMHLHERHRAGAGGRLKLIAGITGLLSRPTTVFVVSFAILTWLSIALMAGHGRATPPLEWLELVAALAGLMVALIILITQRHQEEHAERRAELTLELALVADKRAAKIVGLIEELRRDMPSVITRHDAESVEMSEPSDPKSVLDALSDEAEA